MIIIAIVLGSVIGGLAAYLQYTQAQIMREIEKFEESKKGVSRGSDSG